MEFHRGQFRAKIRADAGQNICVVAACPFVDGAASDPEPGCIDENITDSTLACLFRRIFGFDSQDLAGT